MVRRALIYIGALLSLFVAVSTVKGSTQEIINFSTVEGEIGFTIFSILLFVLLSMMLIAGDNRGDKAS